MAVLIDASILIEAERGRLDLEPHVTRHGEEEAFLSVVTASELLHGVHRATQPDVRARQLGLRRGHPRALPLLSDDLAARGRTRSCGPNYAKLVHSSDLTISGWLRLASPMG